jgi:hypothetical protein
MSELPLNRSSNSFADVTSQIQTAEFKHYNGAAATEWLLKAFFFNGSAAKAASHGFDGSNLLIQNQNIS